MVRSSAIRMCSEKYIICIQKKRYQWAQRGYHTDKGCSSVWISPSGGRQRGALVRWTRLALAVFPINTELKDLAIVDSCFWILKARGIVWNVRVSTYQSFSSCKTYSSAKCSGWPNSCIRYLAFFGCFDHRTTGSYSTGH